MRNLLGTGVLLLALTLRSFAEDDPVVAALPEDMPGGREAAAQDLRSGVPQLVVKRLEILLVDDREPQFDAWRPALEGKAAEDARDVLSELLSFSIERHWECREFREAATRWLESRTEMPAADVARIAWGLRVPSEALAERLKAQAAEGDAAALMSLCGNTAGHPFLKELLASQVPHTRMTQYMMGSSFTQSEAFRGEYERWIKSGDMMSYTQGVNAILRLGNAKDLEHARAYLRRPTAIRRMEIYRSMAWINDPGTVDLLLEDEERALSDTNQQWLARAMSVVDDPRVLPFLRKKRDEGGYPLGVARGLWTLGRAGDVSWLLDRLLAEDSGDELRREAARTLRKLLGRSFPLDREARETAVRAWIESHAEAIAKDEPLPAR